MDVIKACDVCGGKGTYDCDECRGRGERECDLGHTHDCDDCNGRGKNVPCDQCLGCGSYEALLAWREEQAKKLLTREVQAALCSAALTAPGHDALRWYGGELWLRGFPETVVEMVPCVQKRWGVARLGETRAEVRVVVVFDGRPPRAWVDNTLARVNGKEVAA
jgi:hypothetical protein